MFNLEQAVRDAKQAVATKISFELAAHLAEMRGFRRPEGLRLITQSKVDTTERKLSACGRYFTIPGRVRMFADLTCNIDLWPYFRDKLSGPPCGYERLGLVGDYVIVDANADYGTGSFWIRLEHVCLT